MQLHGIDLTIADGQGSPRRRADDHEQRGAPLIIDQHRHRLSYYLALSSRTHPAGPAPFHL